MKRLTAKEKAMELMELYGTYAPFVIQEIVSNMKLIYMEYLEFKVTDFDNFKYKKFWKEVENIVMLELTANSIQYPEAVEDFKTKDIGTGKILHIK